MSLKSCDMNSTGSTTITQFRTSLPSSIVEHSQKAVVNPGCAGRDSDGFRWESVPVVLPGVATAAGNAQGARQGRGRKEKLGKKIK